MANINDNILEAIEILVDSKINQVAFDRTIICKVTNDKKAEDGEYQVSYQNSKFTAYSISDEKYSNNQNVYVLVKDGDFSQEKIIIGAQRTTDTSPYSYSLPSGKVVKATNNLCSIDNNEINVALPSNYDYNLGYQIKYILLSADFTNTDPDNFTGNYTLSLNINGNLYGGLLSSHFYGNAQYADSLNQQILLDMPDIDITEIELIPGIEDGYTIGTQDTDTIKIENIQLHLCYDKTDIPVAEEAISLYTDEKNQSYEYNSNDQDNSLRSVDFYTKILYNQNVIDVDNNSNEYLTETDELVWFKYQLGYSSKIINDDQLKWESLAGTNWAYQGNKTAINNLDKFKAIMDFNMATTQYKVMWVSKIEIIDENGDTVTDWIPRAWDGVIFTNSARVVDETTAEAAASGNSRISLQINNDNNSNFFIYGNDMMAVGSTTFKVKPYFNDNTSITSGTVNLYIPKNSSQIRTVTNSYVLDEEGNKTYTNIYSSNGIDWTIDDNSDDGYQILSCNYDQTDVEDTAQRVLPTIVLNYENINYFRSNNILKCNIQQNDNNYWCSRSLTFGNQNTSGTGYKLNLKCLNEVAALIPSGAKDERTLKYQIVLEDKDGNSLSSILKNSLQYITVTIDNPQNNSNPLFGFEKNIDDNLVLSITLGKYILEEEKENYIVDIEQELSTTEAQTALASNFCTLTVSVKGIAVIGEGKAGTKTLNAKVPIAFRSDNSYKRIDGATRIIFDDANSNPSCDLTPYRLYTNLLSSTPETNITWNLYTKKQYSNDIIGSDAAELRQSKEDSNVVYLAPLANMQSSPQYLNVCASQSDNQILWSQPIIIANASNFTSFVTDWDGASVNINQESGVIMSQVVGAGQKNENNAFSGVIMGTIGLLNKNKEFYQNVTGLYGFQALPNQDGSSASALRFKFDEDGNAYIGKDDNYIDFTDGNLKIAIKNFSLKTDNLFIESDPDLTNKISYNFGNTTSDMASWPILYLNDKQEGIFGITSDGKLYLSGTINASTGTIGGWHITPSKLYKSAFKTDSDGNETEIVTVVQGAVKGTTYSFATGGTNHQSYADCPFRVTHDGLLYVSDIIIEDGLLRQNYQATLQFKAYDDQTQTIKLIQRMGWRGTYYDDDVHDHLPVFGIDYSVWFAKTLYIKGGAIDLTLPGTNGNYIPSPTPGNICMSKGRYIKYNNTYNMLGTSDNGENLVLGDPTQMNSTNIYTSRGYDTESRINFMIGPSSPDTSDSRVAYFDDYGLHFRNSNGILLNEQQAFRYYNNAVCIGAEHLPLQFWCTTINSHLTFTDEYGIKLKGKEAFRYWSGKICVGADDYPLELRGSSFTNSATGTSSDLNKKNSIEPLPNIYSILFDNLCPVIYKYNDGTSNRLHTGFIAQQVKEALDNANISTQNFAGLIIDNQNTEEEQWSLRYEEFIALNTYEIQKLKTRIIELENKIVSLETKLE